jgi:type IV pilus biogenesis protein CpaD/CtpE
VNHRIPVARCLCLLLLSAMLAGCATRPAPDFRGRWKAVNRYAETAQEIPLQQAYSFRASPMDGTLRNMLSRWAKDSKMTLSYLHPSDFTLYAPVARIDTYDLQQAAAQLTTAYAAQRVRVTHSGNQIIVSLADVPASDDASSPSP